MAKAISPLSALKDPQSYGDTHIFVLFVFYMDYENETKTLQETE